MKEGPTLPPLSVPELNKALERPLPTQWMQLILSNLKAYVRLRAGRVWMSPLFCKMKVTKEDLSLEETVTLDATYLDPLGCIQIYHPTKGQIVFIPPSIQHRKPQYLDDLGLAFELLEKAKLRRPYTHVAKLPQFPNGYHPKTGAEKPL